MKIKKVVLSGVCAAALVVGTVAGTMAYLTDKTETITNTFTVGEVTIDLTETWNTDTNNDSQKDAWTAQLIPGTSYAKDPVVTVKAASEKCWLFVEFDEVNNPATYLEYTSNLKAPEWTQGTDTIPGNVWYRIVEDTDADQNWNLLDGNTVTVKTTVGASVSMPGADKAPELVYTAYAVQYDNLDAEVAWAQVAPTA